jgi:hypothetical protein
MAPKHHTAEYFDHILLVFRIIVSECFKYLLFDEPLLKQSLLVQEYLHCHVLLVFVVEALIYLPERPLPKALDYFVSVSNMISDVANVLGVLRVEAVVVHPLGGGAHELGLLKVEVVDLLIV